MVDASIVIAAAGTGGHIYPGLALAEAIRRVAPQEKIVFTGTRRGLESTLIPKAGFPLELYPMTQFVGRQILKTPFVLPQGIWKARSILQRHHAKVAVTMGGYGGLPLAFAAKLAKTPLAIHESGAVAGRANLLAAKLTDHVALAYDSAASDFGRTPTMTLGMPLSADIDGFDRAALRADARASFGLNDDDVMVFITGGSQGARTLNRAAVGLAQRWAAGEHARRNVKIVLKAGSKLLGEVTEQVAAHNTADLLQAVNFLDRIDFAYAAADIIVSRCGAGSVAEIAVVGLPAVFVPYPAAIDDHQALNAAPLVQAGGATLVRDNEATAVRLAAELEPLLDRPELRAERAAKTAAAGFPRAAEKLAEWVLSLAESEAST